MADHWTELAFAVRWERVAELLSEEDPAASRVAWSRAADGYKVYNEAWSAHLPSSRFDHDYEPELGYARAKAGRSVTLAFAGGQSRMPLLQHALDGKFDEAIACVSERPHRRVERAILSLLAMHCGAGRLDEARRLDAWSKELTLSALAANIAAGVSAKSGGEPLSHLDYPPKSTAPHCVTVGFERDGLWRGALLVLERVPMRAALVASTDVATPLTVLDLDDDDPSAVIEAGAAYLRKVGPATPPIDVVNVVCDALQVLYVSLEVPRGRWLPRFSMGRPAEGASWASVDLDGPDDVAWPAVMTFVPGRSGVVIAVAAAYGASGLSVEVSTAQEIIAAAPALMGLVRTMVDRRAIVRGGRK